jgi:2-haloacid dehalogenase
MLAVALEHAGLRDRFAHVLSVDAVGAYKPSRAVYELACLAFGLPPEAILFVSSNGFDVAGAYHFGFPVAWANRLGLAADRLDQAPQVEVRGLDELAAALGA